MIAETERTGGCSIERERLEVGLSCLKMRLASGSLLLGGGDQRAGRQLCQGHRRDERFVAGAYETFTYS